MEKLQLKPTKWTLWKLLEKVQEITGLLNEVLS